MTINIGGPCDGAVPGGHPVERGGVRPADDLVAQPNQRLLNVGLLESENQGVAEALQNHENVSGKERTYLRK